MRRSFPLLAGLVAVAACQQGAASDAEATPSGSAVSAASAAAAAGAAAQARSAASAAGARKVSVDNDLYHFEFSYPAQAGAIPALKTMLDAQLDSQQAELKASAEAQRAEFTGEDIPFRALGRWVDWQVVTELPRWLSLSATVGTYEGGAHPNHAFDAMLWDKRAGVRRDPLNLFASPQALSAAIRPAFCRVLDRERAKRRGEPVNRGSGNFFDECIDPVENTVILGSSHGKSFDRIGILVPPYNAGPYAEGDYEVTLPVTAEVLAAVKPEFRGSFSAAR